MRLIRTIQYHCSLMNAFSSIRAGAFEENDCTLILWLLYGTTPFSCHSDDPCLRTHCVRLFGMLPRSTLRRGRTM